MQRLPVETATQRLAGREQVFLSNKLRGRLRPGSGSQWLGGRGRVGEEVSAHGRSGSGAIVVIDFHAIRNDEPEVVR